MNSNKMSIAAEKETKKKVRLQNENHSRKRKRTITEVLEALVNLIASPSGVATSSFRTV